MSVELTEHESVPPIGLGTWENEDPEQCARSVQTALEMGYRHIDTAQLYQNENAVGTGIKRSSVPREDIFIATKISFKNMKPEEVVRTARESRDRLDLDTIDLLYVHWPAGEYSAENTLPAFDRLVEEGIIHHIGVSNFTIELLDQARGEVSHPIYAHQFEMHPSLSQRELREYGEKHDILSVAYSPLQHGEILDEPVLTKIANRHGCSPARITLAWIVEKGAYPVPKATGEDHLRDNFQALECLLDREEVNQIDEEINEDRYIDPPFAPW